MPKKNDFILLYMYNQFETQSTSVVEPLLVISIPT